MNFYNSPTYRRVYDISQYYIEVLNTCIRLLSLALWLIWCIMVNRYELIVYIMLQLIILPLAGVISMNLYRLLLRFSAKMLHHNNYTLWCYLYLYSRIILKVLKVLNYQRQKFDLFKFLLHPKLVLILLVSHVLKFKILSIIPTGEDI